MPSYDKMSAEEIKDWELGIIKLCDTIMSQYDCYKMFYLSITLFEYILVRSYLVKHNVDELHKESTSISIQTLTSIFSLEYRWLIDAMYTIRNTIVHRPLQRSEYVFHIVKIYSNKDTEYILSTLGISSDLINKLKQTADTISNMNEESRNSNMFMNAINKMKQ